MQVSVWAGIDIYALESISLLDPRDLYQEVCRRHLCEIVEEFGMGAEIKQVSSARYEICVDKVKVC